MRSFLFFAGNAVRRIVVGTHPCRLLGFGAVLLSLLIPGALHAQKNLGMYQDYYYYPKTRGSFVPMAFYEGARGSYLMMRYNYEAEQTMSVLAGKRFRWKNEKREWQWTPSLGILAGNAPGLTASSELMLERGAFFFSSEPIYSRFSSGRNNYLYNWAEAGFTMGDRFFAGAALQTTYTFRDRDWVQEPGLLLGVTAGRIEVPVYLFFSGRQPYLMMGLHYDLDL